MVSPVQYLMCPYLDAWSISAINAGRLAKWEHARDKRKQDEATTLVPFSMLRVQTCDSDGSVWSIDDGIQKGIGDSRRRVKGTWEHTHTMNNASRYRVAFRPAESTSPLFVQVSSLMGYSYGLCHSRREW